MAATSIAPAPARGIQAADYGLFAATVMLWGTTWLALKWQLGTVDPQVSLVWRFLIAAPVTFVLCRAVRQPLRFPLALHARFALLGALMFSTNFILFYNAGHFVVSGLLAVVFSLSSVINIALAALLLGEPIRGRVALGAALGLSGVGCLFWHQIADAALGFAALQGLALGIAGALSFSLGNMLSVTIQRRGVPVMSASAWGMAYGVAVNSGVALLAGSAFVVEPTWRYVGSLLWLAIPGTVLAFWMYLTLLKRIGPDRAAYTAVLSPALALAVSSLMEGYRWTPLGLLGLALVVAGNVAVLSGRSRA